MKGRQLLNGVCPFDEDLREFAMFIKDSINAKIKECHAKYEDIDERDWESCLFAIGTAMAGHRVFSKLERTVGKGKLRKEHINILVSDFRRQCDQAEKIIIAHFEEELR